MVQINFFFFSSVMMIYQIQRRVDRMWFLLLSLTELCFKDTIEHVNDNGSVLPGYSVSV